MNTSIRKGYIVLGLLAGSAVSFGAIVPGFTGAHADFEPKTANLMVEFDEEGLESGGQVDLQASAHLVAIYAPGPGVEGNVRVECDVKGDISVRANGQGSVHGAVVLEPPRTEAGKLISITYSKVGLIDNTNGLPTDIAEELSRNSTGGFLMRHHWHPKKSKGRKSQ